MRSLFTILTFILLSQRLNGQTLYVPSGALIQIGTENNSTANLVVDGDLENNGTINNKGTLTLYGDWNVNNSFNGIDGTLSLLGDVDQMIQPNSLILKGLNLNQGGEVQFTGQQYIVTEDINFQDGVIIVGDSTEFILNENVNVGGGSSSSYFQGRLTYQGSGLRFFPLGLNGQYAPITLFDIVGTDPGFAIEFKNPNPGQPKPGEDLIGVSDRSLWELELTQGSVSEIFMQVDFSDEDLENFAVSNEIRRLFDSPVIAYSDSADGTYSSLGVDELFDTDSLSFGTVISETGITPEEGKKLFLAMALAPRIDPNGLVYIPQAFSPSATDLDNQTFRIFGERIIEDNFVLQVYNRFGILVYTTVSFQEANEIGWNGNNQQTGNNEPNGTYYYFVRLEKENGETFEEKGAVYLVR